MKLAQSYQYIFPPLIYQRLITEQKLGWQQPGERFSLQVGPQLVKIKAGGAPYMLVSPVYDAVPTQINRFFSKANNAGCSIKLIQKNVKTAA